MRAAPSNRQQQMTTIKQFSLEKYHEFDRMFYYMLQLLVNSFQYFISQHPPLGGNQHYHHRRIINGGKVRAVMRVVMG